MASIFVFNRSRGSDDEELALSVPDSSETQSLDRHVERCAMRYKLLTRRLIEQGKTISRVELIVYVLLGWTLITSEAARAVVKIVMAL